MNTLRLKNYRCFDDTGDINLKPLTLLVGANSSGKSSFLKFFPLIKQSVGIKKKGVFLWYSDDVDFKDFKNTVKDGKGNIVIGIEQNLIDRIDDTDNKAFVEYFEDHNIKYNGTTAYIEMTISEVDDNTDYLKQLSISFEDHKISILFTKTNKAKITINNDSFGYDAYGNTQMTGGLLPRIVFMDNDMGIFGSNQVRKTILDYLDFDNTPKKSLIQTMLFRSFYFLKKEHLENWFKTEIKSKRIDLNRLINLYLLYHLNDIIDMVNSSVSSTAVNTSYVRPLRVMPERYYRYQNYSVDEIASDGKNLAMYFANLKESELIKFQGWTSKLFGFKLKPHKLEGHVEIDIIEEGEEGRNMVDTGFGYNQLLPILAIIWNALNNKQRMFYFPYVEHSIKFIVIEQPELHLHPRILAMFAEMLCSVISGLKKDEDVRFIIETHSETIINKVGALIQSSRIDENKVNVVLFNAQKEGLNNYVEQATYDSKGYLNNWPTGFFL